MELLACITHKVWGKMTLEDELPWTETRSLYRSDMLVGEPHLSHGREVREERRDEHIAERLSVYEYEL
jgi:hypothetical protein